MQKKAAERKGSHRYEEADSRDLPRKKEKKKKRDLQKSGAREYAYCITEHPVTILRTTCNFPFLTHVDIRFYGVLGRSLLIELYVAVGELALARARVLAQQRRRAHPRVQQRGENRAFLRKSPLYLRRRQITVLVYPMPQTHQRIVARVVRVSQTRPIML